MTAPSTLPPRSRSRLLAVLRHMKTWGLAGCITAAFAAERPPVTRPRATSGDSGAEPEWSQRLTVTVGSADADLVGTTTRALQAATETACRYLVALCRR